MKINGRKNIILLILLLSLIVLYGCGSVDNDAIETPNADVADSAETNDDATALPNAAVVNSTETDDDETNLLDHHMQTVSSTENEPHQIFYGKWQATDRIYISPMPVRGHMLSYEEMKEDLENFYEIIEGETIHFSRDYIIVNDNEVFHDVQYFITLYPANDNFSICLALTLADIGLVESEANYFAHVRIGTAERTAYIYEGWFFVKNVDTIIIARGEFYVEYERIAFDENHRTPYHWVTPEERPEGFVFPWESSS